MQHTAHTDKHLVLSVLPLSGQPLSGYTILAGYVTMASKHRFRVYPRPWKAARYGARRLRAPKTWCKDGPRDESDVG
jgi:hypothetical protein